MEDDTESLQTIGLKKKFQDDNSYMNIEVKEGKHHTIDGTKVSTFTTETLPLADERRLDILSKISTLSLLSYYLIFNKQEFCPREGEGEMSFPVKKGDSLRKWIVRKHGTSKGFTTI